MKFEEWLKKVKNIDICALRGKKQDESTDTGDVANFAAPVIGTEKKVKKLPSEVTNVEANGKPKGSKDELPKGVRSMKSDIKDLK